MLVARAQVPCKRQDVLHQVVQALGVCLTHLGIALQFDDSLDICDGSTREFQQMGRV